MSEHRHGALVIFGSGPGIGVHVASRFARGGFEKIILLSRNARRLSDDAFIVYSNAPRVQVTTVSADLCIASDVQSALRKIEEMLGDTPVECVHYNAAKVSETWLLQESAEDLRWNLELSVVSLYTIAQWAVPRLAQLAGRNRYKPALLVTSGWLAHEPQPNFFALGVCKSAQQNVIRTLHNQLRSQGVHCALVMVNGRVRTDAEATNPALIAEESWKLYSSQGNGYMEVETDINPTETDREEDIRQQTMDLSFMD